MPAPSARHRRKWSAGEQRGTVARHSRIAAVADGRAVGRTREEHVEGFVALYLGVALERDRHHLAHLVDAELQLAGVGNVVAIGRRGGTVAGCEVDVECRRSAAARDREGRNLGAGIAFADGDVVDGDRARHHAGGARGAA